MTRATASIPITLKLFAAYRDAVGEVECAIAVPTGTTVAGVCDRLIAEHPELAAWQSQTRFGVNLEFVSADTVLHSGDEVVLIPPVSGG
ncbi:MAG: MoaD/ThiS family protein [Cyanobacteria bacterium J06648_11]